jgi:hypothetical protein
MGYSLYCHELLLRGKDLTGLKYGRLLVIEQVTLEVSNRLAWLCHCECGNWTKVRADNLTMRSTKSCGCMSREAPKSKGRWMSL